MKCNAFALAALAAAAASSAAVAQPQRIYGVTITNPWRKLPQTVQALAGLAHKPTARVVFDEGVSAVEYQPVVAEIRKAAFVMGELLDSQYVKTYSVEAYRQRANEYLNTLGMYVDIWEIGNEINGEWLGDTPSVVAKMRAAYDLVKGRNGRTALTLYFNQGCLSNKNNEMFAWTQANVPDYMKQGLDYVMVSYYEDDCNGLQPDWQAVFDKLGRMFPSSLLAIGESGTAKSARKEDYVNRYYRMTVSHPRFVHGGFWWYFDASRKGGGGDMVPMTNRLWSVLNEAIK